VSAPDDGPRGEDAALLTDLYELTMVQAYWHEGLSGTAVFSLHFRDLPEHRNLVLACGLADALDALEALRFGAPALDYLRGLGRFSEPFLDWLAGLRFRGDVFAVPEGTPVFGQEPLLEVVAPIAEAQLVETLLMNQLHVQSALASKAVRVVHAAAGRRVVDFGVRRMHGTDAGVKGARAFHVAGISATSNLLAGRRYGIPVAGTMAHSYVQAHDREEDAFRAFAGLYPGTVLLVDTYDTLAGIDRVIRLSRTLGDDFRVGGVRLDSGDLLALAGECRKRLDAAGLGSVEILASGGLDEHEVDALVRGGAPVAGFGVGTQMGVSRDAPDLDLVYKLTEYDGAGRVKTSPGKPVWPGRKQVFRHEEGGLAVGDTVGRHDERLPGRPLLEPVMRGGRRLEAGRRGPDEARERAARELARLPERIRGLAPADPPYPVVMSAALLRDREQALARARAAG